MPLSPETVRWLNDLARGRGMSVQDYVVAVLTRHAEVKWRFVQRRSDSCKNGHEFTAENTYTSPGRGRRCQACHRQRRREHYYAATEGKVTRRPTHWKRSQDPAREGSE